MGKLILVYSFLLATFDAFAKPEWREGEVFNHSGELPLMSLSYQSDGKIGSLVQSF